uniref:replication factor C subunit 4 isoform X2 n=1 Tax=Pristiophorus japonicus TaxID=55135 RepID=UPI00398ED292
MQAFLKGTGVIGTKPAKEKAAAGTSGENKKQKAVPWVEKYRPKCMAEVAFQEEVVAVLKKSLEGADLPNLLFYGPPGTGKTSTILAAARELFGPELYRKRILELNASDERGIQVVREKVKNFAQLAVAGTRTEIIEPLTSRCSKFRFKPLTDRIQEKRLQDICEKENVQCSSETIAMLINVSEGDLRKAITYLQCATRLTGGKNITQQVIIEIAGVVPTEMIDSLLAACHSSSFEKLETVVKNMINEGYAATQLINQLHEVIIDKEDLNDQQKSAITLKLAEVDKCLADGADEYLQMISLSAVIMQQFTQSS